MEGMVSNQQKGFPMLTIQINGIDQVRAQLGTAGRQAAFAASKALNNAAFAINKQIKADMQGAFQGGATAYTLRAFQVNRASKQRLEASVMLRTDGQGGTPHSQTLAHLFTGGSRQWKRFEGLIRRAGAMPAGSIAVPGRGIRLDARGNMSKAQVAELLGALRTGLQVVRRAGRGKQQKAVGYFVLPQRHGKLLPGIYKRISTGGWLGGGNASSGLQPMIVFVPMGTWRRYINLEAIAQQQLRGFVADFNAQLREALKNAK
jgi:hypothetical protein